MRQSHTTDEEGFNYMDNSGQEERDRDMVGIFAAVALMLLTVIVQRAGWL